MRIKFHIRREIVPVFSLLTLVRLHVVQKVI